MNKLEYPNWNLQNANCWVIKKYIQPKTLELYNVEITYYSKPRYWVFSSRTFFNFNYGNPVDCVSYTLYKTGGVLYGLFSFSNENEWNDDIW